MESSQLVKNLQFLMGKHKESTNAVAVSCGIKASTLKRLLDGASAAPRNSTLQALAMHFGVHPDKLQDGDLSIQTGVLEENKTTTEPIPFLDEYEVLHIYLHNGIDTPKGQKTFYFPLPSNDRTWLPPPPDKDLIDLIRDNADCRVSPIFAYKVKSNAMSPTFNEGDTVFIRYTPTVREVTNNNHFTRFITTEDIKNGDYVLGYFLEDDADEKNSHGHLLVRQYFEDEASEFGCLVSTNPNWPGRKSFPCTRIIGKVVGCYTKF